MLIIFHSGTEELLSKYLGALSIQSHLVQVYNFVTLYILSYIWYWKDTKYVNME